MSGDDERVAALVHQHRDDIASCFADWAAVSPDVRADPESMQRHTSGLIEIARVFEVEHNDSILLDRLRGEDSSCPQDRVETALATAQELTEQGRFEDAIELLMVVDDALAHMTGGDAAYFRAVAHSNHAHCLFHLGRANEAVPLFEAALQSCVRHGDTSGIVAYANSLCEVHRYLGHADVAAEFSDRVYVALKDTDVEVAQQNQRRAHRLRRGEPLNRVVVVVNDSETIELGEPIDSRDSIRFEFVRNRSSPRRALDLLQRARTFMDAGDVEAARRCFRQAQAVDPYEPSAHYEYGLCLLSTGDFHSAAQAFRSTERLAPGWYECRHYLWLAQECGHGRVDARLCSLLLAFSLGVEDKDEQLQLTRLALSIDSTVAAAHLYHARALNELSRPVEAEVAMRNGLECSNDDTDTRTRLLAELAMQVTDPVERNELLFSAVELNGNLVAGALARTVLRWTVN